MMITYRHAAGVPGDLDALVTIVDGDRLLWPRGLTRSIPPGLEYRLMSALPSEHGAIGDFLCPPDLPFPRLVVLRVDNTGQLTIGTMRELGGRLAARLQAAAARRCGLAVDLPPDLLTALLEGLALRAYRFDRHKTTPHLQALGTTVVLGAAGEPAVSWFEKRLAPVVEATHFARDLAAEPANILTPDRMTSAAQDIAAVHGMGFESYDDAALDAIGMAAFLAVGRGSPAGCRLALLSWNGLPEGRRDEPPLVYIGKGVTFDAGGITLKTGPDLEHNKWDMAGAAAVLGAMQALASRGAPVHVVGLVAMAENMPSGLALKPGDVLQTLSGQTVEVTFPDGEGRLILADVLTYAARRFRPAAMIDVATLTDEVSHVLGTDTAGMISDDENLSRGLLAAADATGEALWPLPTGPEYARHLRSDVADMRNWGNGHLAATCIAGEFLRRFAGGQPWAHLDIAWTSWSLWDSPLAGRGATGFGVRLLDRFAEDWFRTG